MLMQSIIQELKRSRFRAQVMHCAVSSSTAATVLLTRLKTIYL